MYFGWVDTRRTRRRPKGAKGCLYINFCFSYSEYFGLGREMFEHVLFSRLAGWLSAVGFRGLLYPTFYVPGTIIAEKT